VRTVNRALCRATFSSSTWVPLAPGAGRPCVTSGVHVTSIAEQLSHLSEFSSDLLSHYELIR
jgi:hypothetical protein